MKIPILSAVMHETMAVQKAHAGRPSSSVLMRSVIFGCVIVGAITWLATLVFIAHQSLPRFTNGVYSIGGSPSQPFSFPLSLDSAGQTVVIDFDVVSPWKYQPDFLIAADDCIAKLQINGADALPDTMQLPHCASDLQQFRFQPFMDTAISHFTVTLDDYGGLAIFNMRAVKSNGLVMLFWLFGVAGLFCCLWLSARILRLNPADTAAACIVAFGVFVRLLYVTVTSYDVRAHEWDKHVDYVRYVSQYFSVPPAAEGWEFHRPPLYYFFAGAWMNLGTVFQRSPEVMLHDLQFFSLLVSIATLLTGTALAYALFKGGAKKHQRLLFIALVAVFPVLILFSSRITNDILAQFLSFLWVLLLLRLWQKGRERDFWTLACVIAAALLTKASAILFLPISLVWILFLKGKTITKRVLWVGLMLLTCVLLAGWLPVLRYAVETDTTRSVVLGNEGIDLSSVVQNSPEAFLTFNPLGVLRHPFNDPYTDEQRRQFFPEYFYKSAFFGEFGFPSSFRTLGFLILLLGLGSLGMALVGLLISIRTRWREGALLLTILGLHLGASIAYRFMFPFAPNQDFRFVTIVLIPWFTFAIMGAFGLPPFFRRSCISILWAWVTVCVLLFLKIFFGPSF